MRALLLLVVACSSKKSEPPAPVAKLDKLEAAVNGSKLALDRAFIRRASPDVETVILGAGKGSCTEDGTLGFTITRRLQPTGQTRDQVTALWSRDFDAQFGKPQDVVVTGNAVTLDITSPKVALHGSFEAVRCPDSAPTGMGAPQVVHPSKGTLTVAGIALDIKGVTVKVRAGVAATDLPDIVISTNVKDCSAVTLPAPVILARTDGKWTLRGTYFEEELAATTSTLAFNANDVGKSPDGPTLELQLEGAGTFGGYPVKMIGTAEAIECVR